MNISTGIITTFYDEGLYGFIFENDTGNELFFHISFLKKEEKPNVGDICEFTPSTGKNGKAQAKNINIITQNTYRIPSVIGVTSWVYKKERDDYGKYGFLNYLNDSGGGFLHKNNIINGLNHVRHGYLYKVDVAKRQGKPVCLNAHEIDINNINLIKKISSDPTQDPRVRLKAYELLANIEGTYNEFEEKCRSWSNKNSHRNFTEETVNLKIPGGLEYSSKGSPSDNTVKIVKNITVCGIIVTALGTAVALVSALKK